MSGTKTKRCDMKESEERLAEIAAGRKAFEERQNAERKRATKLAMRVLDDYLSGESDQFCKHFLDAITEKLNNNQ